MQAARLIPTLLLLCTSLVACGDKLNPILVESSETGTLQDGATADPATPALPSDPTTPAPPTLPTDPAVPKAPTVPTTPSTPQPSNPSPTGVCGTTAAAISYEGQAKAVIAVSCLNCHLGRSPILNNYAASKAGFDTGGGLVAIEGGTMPTGGVTLTTEQKCILTTWAAGGYLP